MTDLKEVLKKSFCMEDDKTLKAAEVVLNEYIKSSGWLTGGMFNTRNTAGDEMETIFSENGLTVDVCYGYSYFEVFGLEPNEFEKVKDWYNTLDNFYLDKEIYTYLAEAIKAVEAENE